MNLKQYFDLYKSSEVLYIIGPLFNADSNYLDPVIYVDGGVNFKKNRAGISVGDGDSSKSDLDILLPQKKDYSDLAFVLTNLASNFKTVYLLGFLGGRRDHELINFAVVHEYLKSAQFPTKVKFDAEVIAYSKGCWKTHIKSIFSIFAFEEAQLKLTGECDYTLETKQRLKPLSGHGLSNVGYGEIEIENSSPVFLFISHEQLV